MPITGKTEQCEHNIENCALLLSILHLVYGIDLDSVQLELAKVSMVDSCLNAVRRNDKDFGFRPDFVRDQLPEILDTHDDILQIIAAVDLSLSVMPLLTSGQT